MSFFKTGNSEIQKGDVRSPKKIIYEKDVNKIIEKLKIEKVLPLMHLDMV